MEKNAQDFCLKSYAVRLHMKQIWEGTGVRICWDQFKKDTE